MKKSRSRNVSAPAVHRLPQGLRGLHPRRRLLASRTKRCQSRTAARPAAKIAWHIHGVACRASLLLRLAHTGQQVGAAEEQIRSAPRRHTSPTVYRHGFVKWQSRLIEIEVGRYGVYRTSIGSTESYLLQFEVFPIDLIRHFTLLLCIARAASEGRERTNGVAQQLDVARATHAQRPQDGRRDSRPLLLRSGRRRVRALPLQRRAPLYPLRALAPAKPSLVSVVWRGRSKGAPALRVDGRTRCWLE